MTREIRYGLQDRITQAVFPLLSWALPRRFHQIRVEELGRAMRLDAEAWLAAPPAPGAAPVVAVLHYPELQRLLRGDALEVAKKISQSP